MNVPILIANVIWIGAFIFQFWELQRLRKQNRKLSRELWQERFDRLAETLDRVQAGAGIPKPVPPSTKPTASQVSQTTQDVMQRMNWNVFPPAPRIAPPTQGDPQPQKRGICKDCGRPILWMGGGILGEWRDHAGKRVCDGIVSGRPGMNHVPAASYEGKENKRGNV